MKFGFTLSLLESKTHPPPKQYDAEVALVKKILTEGQGYLTKGQPVKVVFFDDDNAGE